jgi:hypothetical protein
MPTVNLIVDLPTSINNLTDKLALNRRVQSILGLVFVGEQAPAFAKTYIECISLWITEEIDVMLIRPALMRSAISNRFISLLFLLSCNPCNPSVDLRTNLDCSAPITITMTCIFLLEREFFTPNSYCDGYVLAVPY